MRNEKSPRARLIAGLPGASWKFFRARETKRGSAETFPPEVLTLEQPPWTPPERLPWITFRSIATEPVGQSLSIWTP